MSFLRYRGFFVSFYLICLEKGGEGRGREGGQVWCVGKKVGGERQKRTLHPFSRRGTEAAGPCLVDCRDRSSSSGLQIPDLLYVGNTIFSHPRFT